MSERLKPCPFCGSKSAALEKKNSGYQVRCHYCGARGKYVVARSLKSRTEAINAWNRRDGDAE
jgi:Lar family restriction alleviation protein